MAVTPLAGGVIPRIGIRHTILLSVATSALGVLLTLVHPVWGIVAALAIAACGTFVTQSATMSFIAYRITSGRSLASGLYYAAYSCGGFAGACACGLSYSIGLWPATVAALAATPPIRWVTPWRPHPRLGDTPPRYA